MSALSLVFEDDGEPGVHTQGENLDKAREMSSDAIDARRSQLAPATAMPAERRRPSKRHTLGDDDYAA
jgi:hypothetical protein